jgi:hypothetical protein
VINWLKDFPLYPAYAVGWLIGALKVAYWNGEHDGERWTRYGK